jgi:hypothetical protein
VAASAEPSSVNDKRFFTWTLAPRYSPPTTTNQLGDMMENLAFQLRIRNGTNVNLDVLHVLLPENEVSYLESTRLITYGPYLPNSSPGSTESIFEVRSFVTINTYRNLWYITDYGE